MNYQNIFHPNIFQNLIIKPPSKSLSPVPCSHTQHTKKTNSQIQNQIMDTPIKQLNRNNNTTILRHNKQQITNYYSSNMKQRIENTRADYFQRQNKNRSEGQSLKILYGKRKEQQGNRLINISPFETNDISINLIRQNSDLRQKLNGLMESIIKQRQSNIEQRKRYIKKIEQLQQKLRNQKNQMKNIIKQNQQNLKNQFQQFCHSQKRKYQILQNQNLSLKSQIQSLSKKLLNPQQSKPNIHNFHTNYAHQIITNKTAKKKPHSVQSLALNNYIQSLNNPLKPISKQSNQSKNITHLNIINNTSNLQIPIPSNSTTPNQTGLQAKRRSNSSSSNPTILNNSSTIAAMSREIQSVLLQKSLKGRKKSGINIINRIKLINGQQTERIANITNNKNEPITNNSLKFTTNSVSLNKNIPDKSNNRQINLFHQIRYQRKK